MILKILGTRGETKISCLGYARHSGILIDDAILCDIGDERYLKANPEIILITHFHPDHAFFISRKKQIHGPPIYAPEKPEFFPGVNVVLAPFKQDVYRITPVPVVHSIKVKAQGYIIEKNQKRIFYTGDMVEIHQAYRDLPKMDMVITEASFLRKGGLVRKTAAGDKYGHAGVKDLVSFFKSFTTRIVFTHFGTWFLKDPPNGIKKIKALETADLTIDVASDGKIFRI